MTRMKTTARRVRDSVAWLGRYKWTLTTVAIIALAIFVLVGDASERHDECVRGNVLRYEVRESSETLRRLVNISIRGVDDPSELTARQREFYDDFLAESERLKDAADRLKPVKCD